jgi:hypothetical protein
MTFRRRARTKQYALGRDNFIDRITSAMQIVALRDTPTRQWTSVAVPLLRPCSKFIGGVSFEKKQQRLMALS